MEATEPTCCSPSRCVPGDPRRIRTPSAPARPHKVTEREPAAPAADQSEAGSSWIRLCPCVAREAIRAECGTLDTLTAPPDRRGSAQPITWRRLWLCSDRVGRTCDPAGPCRATCNARAGDGPDRLPTDGC